MKICTTEQEFIQAVAPAAQKACARFQKELGQAFYLPSVLIAQACKENGYGIKSYWDNPGVEALVTYNNMVGIKRDLLNKTWVDIGLSVWDGQYINKKTPEVYGGVPVTIYDDFRIYADPDGVEKSFVDYLCFMRWGGYSVGNPKYYNKIKDLHDYKSLIRMVHSLGYATGTTYSSGIISIIEKHGLYVYDNLSGVEPSKYWPSGASKKEEKKEEQKQEEPTLTINQNPMGIRYHNTSKRSCGIEYIYIHYVGGLGGAKNNIDYYNQTNVTDASADLYVGHQGEIWQYNIVPLERYCWAVGGGRQSPYGGSFYGKAKNANGISIEMCVKSKSGKAPAHPNDPNWYVEDVTVQSTIALTKYLMKLYGITADHVIRHYDVNGKYCPGIVGWNAQTGSESAWEAFKAAIGSGDTPVPTPSTGKIWKVQLGAYKYAANAQKKLEMARAKIDKGAFITDRDADGYIRVQVGAYNVYQNAVNRMNWIKANKLSDAIIKEYDA